MSKKLKVKKTKLKVTEQSVMLSFVVGLPKVLTDGFDLESVDDHFLDSDGLYVFLTLKPKEKK